MKDRILLALFLATMTGCALGPDYQRPSLPTPDAYRETSAQGESFANLPWFELFKDEKLRELIRQALAENKDLKIAAARIEEARAQYGFTKAGMWPSFRYEGSAGRINPSDKTSLPGDTTDAYRIGAGFTWEIDVWGKYRRSNEAARAELLASEEGRRAILLTLVADVASLYFQLRGLDERLEISRQTLTARKESTRLIAARLEKGAVAEIDFRQAEIQEDIAGSAVPSFERDMVQTENALSVLLGRPPGTIVRGAALDEQGIPPEVPAGLPSNIIQARPDVLVAEESLHAQMARIGVAQALRWPAFSLTGAGGIESTELSQWISLGAGFWNLGGTLAGPLFEFGKNKRRVEIEKARTEQLLQSYEKSVLVAFREVEDSLVAVRTFREESTIRKHQAASAASASKLSQARYMGGVTSYLEVLDSQRSEFEAALAASIASQQRVVSVVQLYKALGGGWQTSEPTAENPPK